jgi:hypothetical protein
MAAIALQFRISQNWHSCCIVSLTSLSCDPRNSDMDLDQWSRSEFDSMAVIEYPYRISRFQHSCCLFFYFS